MSTTSHPDLEGAIAALYNAFASYGLADVVEGCPCCVSAEEQARLRSKPLRLLTDGDLGGFAFSALSTWDTLHDLKHFLPRILELAANGTLRVDLQQIYGKLVQEGPWREAELEALERFTRALFVRSMSGHRPPPVDVLESAGLARMDIAALLDAAFAVRSPERTTALARLIWDQAASLASGVPHWIWWRDDQELALRRWLSTRDAYGVLVAAFEADPDHPDAGEWAQAADVLEALGDDP